MIEVRTVTFARCTACSYFWKASTTPPFEEPDKCPSCGKGKAWKPEAQQMSDAAKERLSRWGHQKRQKAQAGHGEDPDYGF